MSSCSMLLAISLLFSGGGLALSTVAYRMARARERRARGL